MEALSATYEGRDVRRRGRGERSRLRRKGEGHADRPLQRLPDAAVSGPRLQRLGVELGMQQGIQVAGVDHGHGLLLGDLSLIHI